MIRFLIIFVFSTMVLADPQKGLISGDQAAEMFLKNSNQNSISAGNHPFYQGIPPESSISSDNLKGQSQRVSNGDQAAQMIYQSSEARPQIKIDATKDPLLTGSETLLANPLEAIGGKGTQATAMQQGGTTEIKSCEEAGDNSLETCTSELSVKVNKIKVTKELISTVRLTGCRKSCKDWHGKSCENLLGQLISWRHGWYRPKVFGRMEKIPASVPLDITDSFKACLTDPGARCEKCNNPRNTVPREIPLDKIKQVLIVKSPSGTPQISGFTNYCPHAHRHLKGYDMSANIKIIYEEDSYEILPDEWSDNCARLEERVDSGLCSYATKVCTKGPETRTIGGIPITRDCWQQTMTYSCSYASKDDCGPLKAQGCAQINSLCKQKVGNVCVEYVQTYQCKSAPRTAFQITGGKTPFCMDGNCRDQSWENNDEMMSSIAQLSLLKEMQVQFANGLLFKGEDKRCSKYILSFKDCCGSGKGWGNDIGLASCSGGEKDLSKRRKKGLCHFVGTYCAKKVLGKCIKKRSSYCCFTNKLLKAFHEQGRPQIGLGWGAPKEPLCRGFTVEEIQRIDFSKLDLREVFEEIMQNFRSGKSNTNDMGRTIKDRMDTIQKTIIQNPSKSVKQRDGA